MLYMIQESQKESARQTLTSTHHYIGIHSHNKCRKTHIHASLSLSIDTKEYSPLPPALGPNNNNSC